MPGPETAVTLDRRGLSGGTLLITDLRVAYLLMNEARYRALERVLGVPRDQANLVTFVLLLIAAEAAQERMRRIRSALSGPSSADALLGAGALNEFLHELGGPSSRETPLFGALVTLALLGGVWHPILRRSMHGVGALSHQARLAFKRRYRSLASSGGRLGTAPPMNRSVGLTP